jgi:putative oxidoreductase
MDFLKPYTSHLLSLLRIMAGLLLLQHGTTKYLSIPVSRMSGISPTTMSGAAGILELVGGVLIILGLFTRPVAFILSGMLAVAYFLAHAPQGFFPILNGGELAALYCFVFLFLAAAGGGAWSLDNKFLGQERRLARKMPLASIPALRAQAGRGNKRRRTPRLRFARELSATASLPAPPCRWPCRSRPGHAPSSGLPHRSARRPP